MEITRIEVEEYLDRVKVAVENDNYRIEMNKNRSDNRNLFVDYVLSEASIKEILLNLTDYSLVIAPVVADLCTTPVALSAPPNSYQNNSQS